jgi:hypothetical protein
MTQKSKDYFLRFRELVYIENGMFLLCDKLLTDVEQDGEMFLVAIEMAVSCIVSVVTPCCYNKK